MTLEKIGKVQLSKSGKALEVKIDKWPTSTFTWYCYIPKEVVRKILDKKIAQTDISLLVGNERNMNCEKKVS